MSPLLQKVLKARPTDLAEFAVGHLERVIDNQRNKNGSSGGAPSTQFSSNLFTEGAASVLPFLS